MRSTGRIQRHALSAALVLAALALAALALAGCGDRAYERSVALLREGDLRGAEQAAREAGGPVGDFLSGNIAYEECLRAAKQAETAAAEPFAFDVAIAFAEQAEAAWKRAAMSRDDWPRARRNVERAQAKAADLRRRKREAEDRLRPKPKPKPQPKPKPEPEPEGKKKITEEDPDADPMLKELPPEEVAGILERLAEKEREKRTLRRAEREKSAVARDW
jgi:hypothetical protein